MQQNFKVVQIIIKENNVGNTNIFYVTLNEAGSPFRELQIGAEGGGVVLLQNKE